MKDKLWWVMLGLAAILMLSNAKAGEWNDKPVICEQKEIFEKTMVERGEILFSRGEMLATVRTKDGVRNTSNITSKNLYKSRKENFYYCRISYRL